jgi:hypothetical protein
MVGLLDPPEDGVLANTYNKYTQHRPSLMNLASMIIMSLNVNRLYLERHQSEPLKEATAYKNIPVQIDVSVVSVVDTKNPTAVRESSQILRQEE